MYNRNCSCDLFIPKMWLLKHHFMLAKVLSSHYYPTITHYSPGGQRTSCRSNLHTFRGGKLRPRGIPCWPKGTGAKPELGLVFIISALLNLPLKVIDSNARFRLSLLILFSSGSKVCWEGCGFWSKLTLVQIQALPRTSSGTMNKSLPGFEYPVKWGEKYVSK